MSEQFACKCCGHCCEGRGGIVVSPTDLERLCTALQLSPEEFETRFGERKGGKLHITVGASGKCIFFSKETACSVHAAKPDICRAWPYFRGNLLDPESLALAKDFCPGIPHALPFADFVQEGLAYLQTNNLVAAGSGQEANALSVSDLIAKYNKEGPHDT